MYIGSVEQKKIILQGNIYKLYEFKEIENSNKKLSAKGFHDVIKALKNLALLIIILDPIGRAV